MRKTKKTSSARSRSRELSRISRKVKSAPSRMKKTKSSTSNRSRSNRPVRYQYPYLTNKGLSIALKQPNLPPELVRKIMEEIRKKSAKTITRKFRNRPFQTNLLCLKKEVNKRKKHDEFNEDDEHDIDNVIKDIESQLDNYPDEPCFWNSQKDNTWCRQISNYSSSELLESFNL